MYLAGPWKTPSKKCPWTTSEFSIRSRPWPSALPSLYTACGNVKLNLDSIENAGMYILKLGLFIQSTWIMLTPLASSFGLMRVPRPSLRPRTQCPQARLPSIICAWEGKAVKSTPTKCVNLEEFFFSQQNSVNECPQARLPTIICAWELLSEKREGCQKSSNRFFLSALTEWICCSFVKIFYGLWNKIVKIFLWKSSARDLGMFTCLCSSHSCNSSPPHLQKRTTTTYIAKWTTTAKLKQNFLSHTKSLWIHKSFKVGIKFKS